MTVLAPSDAAFQTLLFGSIYGALLAQGLSSDSGCTSHCAFINPRVIHQPRALQCAYRSYGSGIIAYHLLATKNPLNGAFEPNIRVFSVNFPPTPSFVTTLVNSSFAPHPGIMVNATFTGPFVTDLKFTGVGTFPPGGLPFSGTPATATSLDNHAVNGVYYVIDKVLLPQ